VLHVKALALGEVLGRVAPFDIRNPDQPIQLGIYHIVQATDIQVLNNFAYVTTYDRGLQIVDVSNPAQLRIHGSFTPVLP
jgi:hypothetical protein